MQPTSSHTPRSRAEIEAAVAALEGQRSVLGDAVVEVALEPLRQQLAALAAGDAREVRRVVTILFADLEGFTTMATRADPEDVRDVVGRCFTRWRAAVEEHGGVVEKFVGDAVMAVFGLHRTAEDDAARAVRAGRAVVAATAAVRNEVDGVLDVPLRVRVGVDTGEVVVSTLGERDGEPFVAVGPTVNRASRLQAHAPADGVLVSEQVRRQLRGRFGLEPRPGLVLKGFDEPVDGFVVLAERPRGFELEPGVGVGGVEARTVGRDAELLGLQELLADVVADARWRVVTVVGEAGVGKSRLLREVDTWLSERPEPVWWLRGRASPSSSRRPHGLLRDAVVTRFEITAGQTPAEVLQRCVTGFAAAFDASPRTRRDALVVARWLGFEVDVENEAVPTDPQALQVEASGLLARYLERLSRTAPVVVLLEDLHWADDASLRWVDEADEALAHAPVLVLATARPALLEQRPHWGEGRDHHRRLALGPLSRRQTRLLVGQLLRRVADVPADLLDLVADRSEGNPFYAEELVTWLVDAGVVVPDGDRWRVGGEDRPTERLPTTLTGLLQARLDALDERERDVLQRAAVVGRVFWDDAVAALAETSEDDLAVVLDRLRERDLVQQREVSVFAPARELVFRHALLRDVTYASLLRTHRRRHHAGVAAWLAAVTAAAGRTEELAAVVAAHLESAGSAEAGGWFLRAGRRAASVYAVDEADRLLQRGLEVAGDDATRVALLLEHEEVLDRLGERDRQLSDLDGVAQLLAGQDDEVALRHTLARARYSLSVSAYGDAVDWARRAADAAQALGRTTDRAHAHLWAGKAGVWTGAPEAEAELRTAIRLAEEASEPSVAAEAWRYLGMQAGNTGDYPLAIQRVERARAMFAEAGDLGGQGAALTQLATTAFHLGHLRTARTHLEEARVALARAGRRGAEVVVLSNLATVAGGQGELAAALSWARDGLRLNRDLQDLEHGATTLVVLAELELQLGRWRDAAQHAREAEELVGPVPQTTVVRTNAIAVQAHAWSSQGQHDRALELARRAVATGERSGSPRDLAFAQLALGYVATAAGDPATGLVAFDAAVQGYGDLAVDGYATESRAARAEALRRLGRTDEALAAVDGLLDHVTETDLEGAQPEYAWWWCWQVLRDAGDDRAAAFREHAATLLRARADRIGDDVLAAEFLARPVAQALLP